MSTSHERPDGATLRLPPIRDFQQGGKMPSGVTHIMLSRKVLDRIAFEKDTMILTILQKERGAYVVGSVGPDLPYMTLMDLDIFKNRKNIADDFHYKKTNQLPLFGFNEARAKVRALEEDVADSLFAFNVGYCSHIFADGLIHPYVRDKVGDYEVAATEHRALEMKLDVFIAEHLFDLEANKISFHEELQWIKDCKEEAPLFESISRAIQTVYGHQVEPQEIKQWISILDGVFDIATGNFPEWYQGLMGDYGLVLKDLGVLKKEREKILTLGLPIDHKEKGLSENYMWKSKVDFFKDVLPQYFEEFSKFIIKAYEYVYEDGAAVDPYLPLINLDTGRLIASQELSNKPAFLELKV